MSNPLHICLVSQEYPPETGWGGIGSYIYELAHGLVEFGQYVTVIARAANPAQQRVIDDRGVRVARVMPSPDWDRMPAMWRLNRIWQGFAWAASRRLREIHRETPVDLVEYGEARADGFFLSMLPRQPKTVVKLHTAWIFVDRWHHVIPDFQKRLVYWQEKQSILRADAISAPSQGIVDLTATWVRLPLQKTTIVTYPINVHAFAPVGIGRKKEVLFVSRLEERKGVRTLASALPIVLERCPDCTFRFLGGEGENHTGRSWRETLLGGLEPAKTNRVEFGQVQRHELVRYYSAAAVCVLPSVWENFPNSLLEAMACGTPVVATQVGGIPEMVSNGKDGLLVPPNDPQSLANAICELMQDADRRAQMGKSARAHVLDCFGTEKVVPRTLAYYKSVLDSN